MRSRFAIAACVSALCWSVPAGAQETIDPPRAGTLKVLEVRPEGQIESPANQAEGGLPRTAINAFASSEDGEIAFTLSGARNAKLGAGGQSIFSLTLSSPIGDDDSDASFITSDGLADTLNLKFNFSRVFIDLTDAAPLETAYAATCAKASKEAFARQNSVTDANAFRDSYCGFGTAVHLLSQEQLERGLSAENAAIVRAHRGLRDRPVKILNLSASIGRKKYGYLRPADLAEQSSTRIPFAFSVAYGINPSAEAPFYGIGYEFKREYSEGEIRTICPAPTGPGPVDCKTSVFDAPGKEDTNRIFALVRSTRLFGDPATQFAPAVELRGAYDFEKNILGFTLPIYFLLDGKGGTKGGFRISVDKQLDGAKDTDVGFGIFVTKSFDYFDIK